MEFVIGVFVGATLIFVVLSAFNYKHNQSGISIDECFDCRAKLCADCNHAAELRATREALATERKRTAAWKGEANRFRGLLWYSDQAKREGVAT